MRKGIDISSWQGDVDFHALKDNADFVIIRSTYGNGYIDKKFTRNRDEARKVGLGIGFYHYAYPGLNSPLAEADWFTKVVSCQPGELLFLDFEEHYPDPVSWSKTFLDRCTSNMGFKPLLYINNALAKGNDWTPVINAGYGLWLAYWDYNPDSTTWDTPWPLVAMRQYSNKGNVAGITPVDLDVFYGTMEQFKAYGNPPPPPLTTTETPTISATMTTFAPVTYTTYTTGTPTTILPSPTPGFFAKLVAWLKSLFHHN